MLVLKAVFHMIFSNFAHLIPHQDLTALIASKGYWASYNVPYFAETSQLSGNKQVSVEVVLLCCIYL